MRGSRRLTLAGSKTMLKKFLKDEHGATAIEYGLIVAVLSLAIIGGFAQAVNVMHNNFNTQTEIINNSINN